MASMKIGKAWLHPEPEENASSSFQYVEGHGGLSQPRALTDGKHSKMAPSESDGSPAGILGSSSVDRRTPGSVRGKVPAKRGDRSQAWSQRAAIRLKLGLNRELRLAEKRLECPTLGSEGSARQHHAKSLCPAAAGPRANSLPL